MIEIHTARDLGLAVAEIAAAVVAVKVFIWLFW